MQTYRRLLRYLRPHKGMFLVGVLVPTIPAVTASLVDTAVMLAANAASAFR